MIFADMNADHVIHFARVDFRNDDRVFGIKDEDRFLHLYVIGKTGTGKAFFFFPNHPICYVPAMEKRQES
jgi:hypothetical protein